MECLIEFLDKCLAKYRNKDATKRELLVVLESYGDLKPNFQPHFFNDGSGKYFVALEGTIPVRYHGSTYNIPICMFLVETHPVNPPLCYIRPTPTMEIRTGKHVDSSGMVYLPYLHDWKHPTSDLIGLIEVMRVVFGEEPAVFVKLPSLHRQAAAQSYVGVPRNPFNQPYPMATLHTRPAASHMQTATQPYPHLPLNTFNQPYRMETMRTRSAASHHESAAQPCMEVSRHTMCQGVTTLPKENAVFLSYQWDHQDKVLLLHNRLQERGYGCWMDIKQMGGGDSLYQMMDKGIREAKVLVSCVTPSYVESQNCQDEVALAHTLKMPIIPVMLENTRWPPPGPMSIPFAQLIFINMTKSQVDDPWKGPLFEELIRMIDNFVHE